MKHVQDIRREHDYWLSSLKNQVDMDIIHNITLATLNGLRFALDLPHIQPHSSREWMMKQLEQIKDEELEA